MNDLEKRAEALIRAYAQAPDSVSKDAVTNLIYDTYQQAVTCFEEKMALGETLAPGEQEVYERCKNELSNRPATDIQLTSIYGAVFNSIELIQNCIRQVKYWFNMNSNIDDANDCLIRAGNALLPGYAGIIRGLFTTVAEFFTPVFTPTSIGLAEAQAECALRYQQTKAVDKALASTMLTIAGYAYEGHSTSQPGEYVKLSALELPSELRILYDEEQGLLSASNGMRVWLGKKDDSVVVAYSGTDIQNVDMIYADIIQLSAPSILYLKAAGLLKLLLEHMPNKKFYVTGHSLGGGLTQFSVSANMAENAERLQGFGYNPAGLSMTSLRYVKADRLKKACEKICIFMTCYDPVSLVGGKLGCLTTLPKTEKNGHGMADLKVCMAKYIQTPQPAPSPDIKITWRNHDEGDFIPYTRKLSFQDQQGVVYPVFNKNPSGESNAFLTVKIPQSLFAQLGIQTEVADSCMGVYNKLNGTAHTVMNRMLLLTEDGPTITDQSIGNIHSSIIYGKFGLDIKPFLDTLEKAYAESQEAFSGSRTTYERVLATLNNPIEYDKQAWCDGIRVQFGIDMKDIFRRWPLAESYFDTFLNKVTADRADIYRSVMSQRSPGPDAVQEFLSKLEISVLQNVEKLLDEAVKWSVITAEEEKEYLEEIKDFCDQVLERI